MWIIFIGLVAVICYLSFVNGEEAKAQGADLIYKLAQKYYGVNDIPDEVMLSFTYKFRQIGRILIFIMLGIIGTLTIHLTFYNWWWIIRTAISVIMLVLIATFTEEYKNYLPTRHFSKEEMLISIMGVLLGFIFITVVTAVYGFIKGVSNIFIGKNGDIR